MTTKTKLTREEKLAAEAAERRSKRIAEYRQRVERERQQPVMQTSTDALRLGDAPGSPFFGKADVQSLLYSVLSRFEYAQRNYETSRGWLRSRTEELDRHAAENYLSGSDAENLARTAVEVAASAATLKAAAEAVADASRMAGVYCPAIYSVRERQRRINRLGLRVERALPTSDGKEWMLTRESAEPLGGFAGDARLAYYATEEDAWAALATVAGDYSEVN